MEISKYVFGITSRQKVLIYYQSLETENNVMIDPNPMIMEPLDASFLSLVDKAKSSMRWDFLRGRSYKCRHPEGIFSD